MIIKLFGLLDVLAGLSLILLKFNILPTLSLIFAIYLIIKGLMFITDLTSIIDLICGIVIIISFIGFFSGFSWIVVVWLIQKGVFSLIRF